MGNSVLEESDLIEVSDIMDYFDIEEITQNVSRQVTNEDGLDGTGELIVDYLSPIYYKYESIVKDESLTIEEELRMMARERFYEICRQIIRFISDKYDLEVADDYLSEHDSMIPAITLALYSFFVLHYTKNLYAVIKNYIDKHVDSIVETFQDMKSKKDATTLINKKRMSDEEALIISNIYNISEWVLQQLDEEGFLELGEPEYLPGKLIRAMYEEGNLSGEFMDKICSEFHSNVNLKSNIGFTYFTAKTQELEAIDYFEDGKREGVVASE